MENFRSFEIVALGDEITMNSVLSSLILSLFLIIQDLTSEMQVVINQFFSRGFKIEFAIYLCVIGINMVINVVVIKNSAEW